MSQPHLDRLSAADAAFLAPSGARRTCTSAGWPFDGAAPDLDDLLAHVRRAAAPRAALPPEARDAAAGLGRPRWVDDPRFNLGYHVRHTALPEPGGEERAARAGRRGCSRSGWTARSRCGSCGWSRAWSDGGFALLSKTHPALVDGVSGVDLADALFDLAPEGPSPTTPPTRGCRSPSRRAPSSPPTACSARGARAGRAAARGSRCRRPGAALDRAREWPRASARSRWPALNPAPDSPFNVRDRPAPPLRVLVARARRVPAGSRTRSAPRSTTSCSRSSPAARARFLRRRGLRTEGIELRAPRAGLAPRRRPARRARQPAHPDHGPLPIDVADPLDAAARASATRWPG